MKFAIAVFTALIIGSNAGLLGNLPVVSPLLDSIAAMAEANGLLSKFLQQISPIVANANQDINQQVPDVTETLQGLLNGALTEVAQLDISDITELISEITTVLDILQLNTTSAINQATTVLNGLGGQISNTVNPYITALGDQIRSGKLKLKCFINEVPIIKEKIGGVVANAQNNISPEVAKLRAAVSKATGAVKKILDDIGVLFKPDFTTDEGLKTIFAGLTKVRDSAVTSSVETAKELIEVTEGVVENVALAIKNTELGLIAIQKQVIACA